MANGDAKILATNKEFSTLEEAESYMSSDDTSPQPAPKGSKAG